METMVNNVVYLTMGALPRQSFDKAIKDVLLTD
jgi:hypothetical protein